MRPGTHNGNAMLTATLVLANVAVFAFELSLGDNVESLVRRWGLVPADLADNPAALVTLLTSTFLHASWLHLLSNLLYLAVFGLPIERRIGSTRFGMLYLASALAGTRIILASDREGAGRAIAARVACRTTACRAGQFDVQQRRRVVGAPRRS